MRGDYANLTAVIDLTLSRIDAGFFTGTRLEGNLTELEMQWGRTIGQTAQPLHRAAIRWWRPTTSTRGPDMHLTRRIWIQLAIFTGDRARRGRRSWLFGYIRLPAMLRRRPLHRDRRAAAGRRAVPAANVTYRGTEVGQVEEVRLTDTGVEAVLSLKSDIEDPVGSRRRRCTARPRSASSTSRCCHATAPRRR